MPHPGIGSCGGRGGVVSRASEECFGGDIERGVGGVLAGGGVSLKQAKRTTKGFAGGGREGGGVA